MSAHELTGVGCHDDASAAAPVCREAGWEEGFIGMGVFSEYVSSEVLIFRLIVQVKYVAPPSGAPDTVEFH